MRGTLLMVGTDREYLMTLEEHLRVCDIACSVFDWSSAELTRAGASGFDVLLMDVDAMPDPLPLLRSYRNAIGQGPLLACSRQFTAVDVVLAYGAGVDDYFAKSTEIVIVEAKIRRAVRRSQYHYHSGNAASLEPSNSPHRGLVQLLDARLTRCEFRLLELLANTPGQLVPRSSILERLWGHSGADPKLLYEHVSTLRSKLLPFSWTVANVRGKGYRLELVASGTSDCVASDNRSTTTIPSPYCNSTLAELRGESEAERQRRAELDEQCEEIAVGTELSASS